jgi:hypothetical protein
MLSELHSSKKRPKDVDIKCVPLSCAWLCVPVSVLWMDQVCVGVWVLVLVGGDVCLYTQHPHSHTPIHTCTYIRRTQRGKLIHWIEALHGTMEVDVLEQEAFGIR